MGIKNILKSAMVKKSVFGLLLAGIITVSCTEMSVLPARPNLTGSAIDLKDCLIRPACIYSANGISVVVDFDGTDYEIFEYDSPKL